VDSGPPHVPKCIFHSLEGTSNRAETPPWGAHSPACTGSPIPQSTPAPQVTLGGHGAGSLAQTADVDTDTVSSLRGFLIYFYFCGVNFCHSGAAHATAPASGLSPSSHPSASDCCLQPAPAPTLLGTGWPRNTATASLATALLGPWGQLHTEHKVAASFWCNRGEQRHQPGWGMDQAAGL